ncbi:MAG TPA: heme peroxidase family protein [Solirubrobacter sp.]|nr:heme peroxidase family protein [Solirubrobacter sp.]
MFGALPAAKLESTAVDDLVKAMAGAPAIGDNPAIPAGFTYLAQFIDHDITFDPTSQLQKRNDPDALVNFRTPRLDLDSLYGAGPADQPYLYEWDNADDRSIKLLVVDDDLPRNGQGLALIGDPRNDENLILAQLHLLFVRFHNRVVDRVRAERGLAGAALLLEAQRIVRWHYQWIVGHDFLRRIVGHEMHGMSYRWPGDPFIPVEFSGAAYRFGHSMVRGAYKMNRRTAEHPVAIFAPVEDPESPDLVGFRHVPSDLRIEWEFFFTLKADTAPQRSRRIDTSLSGPLFHLPAAISPEREALARLNLRRGWALGLPSGRDVALAMGVEPLSDEELQLDTVKKRSVDALRSAPPLWYYVLCEASTEKGGNEGLHLGPVGARIVLEVLTGLLDGDPNGYRRRWPAWSPELPRAKPDDFTMADLINFTG